MDEDREQELWRLRSVDYDLEALQAQYKELQERHDLLRDKAAAALEQCEKVETKWKSVAGENIRLADELANAENTIHARDEVIEKLKTDIRYGVASNHMESIYGFKVQHGDEVKRRGWRLSK